MIVQEYINNPLLINDLKFDIRIYVLMTSINPLKLYIFEDGLVRFATEKYSNKMSDLGNNYIHLTNYTVNKDSLKFVHSEEPGEFVGHKWNLKTLWKYFDEVLEKDWRQAWEETKEVCIKTILCGYDHIKSEVDNKIGSHYNCYKLFGFDILYDENLKPWLIEVNNIPSLFTNTIDSHVNRPMVQEMLNIVGIHVPSTVACKHNKAVVKCLELEQFGIKNISYDERLYMKRKLTEEVEKECLYSAGIESSTILNNLTPNDVRLLIRAEEELNQTRNWSRLLPSCNRRQYLDWSYSDALLHTWEVKYGASQESREEGRELLRSFCKEKYHLVVNSKM